MSESHILQIVPQLPGTLDGVGDYALNLAKGLSAQYGVRTVFGVAQKTTVAAKDGFAVISLLDHAVDPLRREWDHVILHYVNYGYQPRGLPFGLRAFLKELRPKRGGVFLTVFHEMYAFSPPWKSAFWLQPFQRRIAREISRISDHRIVSNTVALGQLCHLDPGCSVLLQPVPSNFGEPLSLDENNRRDPHRWAICGGNELLLRSVSSFITARRFIPENSRPRELFVLGGKENSVVRSLVQDAQDLEIIYRPDISVASASEILSSCSFGWIDYFNSRDVPTAVLLKSGSFSAYCAHGVIPVFPRPGSAISLSGDCLPGPFFVSRDRTDLPAGKDFVQISAEIYGWYKRNAAIDVLAEKIMELIGSAASTAKTGSLEREVL